MSNRRLRFLGVAIASTALILLFQDCSKDYKIDTSGGLDSSENNTIPPLYCSIGQKTGSALQTFPTACLVTQNLPTTTMGLEMNNNDVLASGGAKNVFNLPANDPVNGVSVDTRLYIEIATYTAPDTIVISAISGSGSTELLNICDISTYSEGDPSGGTKRPYSDTVLQFNVTMPKGTTALLFDFTQALTPTYVGVWNLNEFSKALNNPSINPFLSMGFGSSYRVQTSLPAPLNDNADPLKTETCEPP